MAVQTRKIQTIEIQLDPRPGALAKVYSAFHEAKINILASWGYEMGPGEASLILCPTELLKAKTVLSQMGFEQQVGTACLAEGDDEPGAYSELLQKIANAGVNLSATDALSLNGRFASVFFTEPEQFLTLCKALGC